MNASRFMAKIESVALEDEDRVGYCLRVTVDVGSGHTFFILRDADDVWPLLWIARSNEMQIELRSLYGRACWVKRSVSDTYSWDGLA